MSTLLYTHSSFLEHDTGGGHPERADRLRAIERILSHDLYDGLERLSAPRIDPAAIEYAHPKAYREALDNAVPEKGIIYLDSDTIMSPGSMEAAYHAVGAVCDAVDRVMTGKADNAFCAVRPPGHHAESLRPMGFCLFNNVAIAAKHARDKHGAERVAVVDFDVHHGNGTQEIFWEEKDLLYASTHQMPLYPGTGALSETGVGNIFNAPLKSGDGGDELKEAFNERILPALNTFNPDFLLISAGFDAHADDPLAGLNMREPDFAWVTQKLLEVADNKCEGRVVSTLEGGYDLTALAKSTGVHVKVLMDAGS